MEGFQDVLMSLLQVVIIGAVPIIAKFVIDFINKKTEHITAQIQNETAKNALQELSDAVSAAVAHTSASYVDELKKTDKFSVESQKAALEKAKEAALAALTPAAKQFLEENHDNLAHLLETKIEEAVKAQKA